MKKRLVSVVLVAAFAFSMLAGCGSDNSAANDNKNNTSAEAEKTASKDGDFNLTVNFASEPMTMDPALNSSVDGAVMANHLFEGLMKWESTGEEVEGSDGTCDSAKLTYGQAESYDKTANDDGTVTYTFVMASNGLTEKRLQQATLSMLGNVWLTRLQQQITTTCLIVL